MKKAMMIILSMSTILFLVNCATAYGPKELAGGYTEEMLTENTYQVSFEGNQYNDMDQVQRYLMFRCAELTLEKNYTHFLILEDASFKEEGEKEFTESDLKIETRTSMSGGVNTTVSSNFGAESTSSNMMGVYVIFLRNGPDPSYPSASNDAQAFMANNETLIKRKK